jgi:hypothetical protein
VTPDVLDRRRLNRALLARQHLLERSDMPPLSMVEHLAGMQAQNPLDPYVALWSRLEAFEPSELAAAISDRRAVRMGLLRTTLHLATADDALSLYPVIRSVLERAWRSSPFIKQLPDVDIGAVLAESRRCLEAEPMTTSELGRQLHEVWPQYPASPLAYAARFLLPIVQLPPRGLWGKTGRPTWTTLESWLGRPLSSTSTADQWVRRYLAAFGPASVADIRTWSWSTGLREVVDRLRPDLVTFRDEGGRELFDLPDAPRPDPETPAPPRFLPEYDNVALSHDDRSRIIAESAFGKLTGWVGTFTTDGFIRGQWRINQARDSATLILQPFEPLPAADSDGLVAEGERLLQFHAPAVGDRRVEFGVAREPAPDGAPSIGGAGRVAGARS